MSMDREFRSRSPHPGKTSPKWLQERRDSPEHRARRGTSSRNLATASPLAYGAGASAGRTHASWASDPSCPLGNVTLRALGPGSRLRLPRAPSRGGGSRSWAWGLPLLRPSLWFPESEASTAEKHPRRGRTRGPGEPARPPPSAPHRPRLPAARASPGCLVHRVRVECQQQPKRLSASPSSAP